MGGGLGMHPACHHTHKKISGEPTGQDFHLPPSLPSPPPQTLGQEKQRAPLCLPEVLELSCWSVCLRTRNAWKSSYRMAAWMVRVLSCCRVQLQLKSLWSHSISLVQSLSLPSAPGHSGQRLDPWENKERKSTPRCLQSLPGLPVCPRAPGPQCGSSILCVVPGVWVWGVASLKSGTVSSDSLLWGTLRRQFVAPDRSSRLKPATGDCVKDSERWTKERLSWGHWGKSTLL